MDWSRGERIGHGSFGSVNLAIPRNRNSSHVPSLMAVKSTSVSNSYSLKNEREVLSELSDCLHVIRCFGDDYSFENGERLHNLFLEYASGGSLADQMKNSGGMLPEFDVRRYTKSVLKGLRYIHVNGFVHCDIKIQNILLCSENGNDVVKIADFGLAKRANCCEGATGFRGTPLNMSPESVTGGEYESPADIWALGCAVVEMVTGKPAWRCQPGSDVNSLLFRIGIGAELPEIPGELSEEGKDFLRKCFVKDPRKRWTAEMLLDHPFVAAAAVDGGDDDHYTVPLKVEYKEASTSPRCPFDFPDWVSIQSPSTMTPSPIYPSPVSVSDTQFDEELNLWSGSSSTCSHNLPENRLRQLVNDQRPDWSFSDSWVTVR